MEWPAAALATDATVNRISMNSFQHFRNQSLFLIDHNFGWKKTIIAFVRGNVYIQNESGT